MFLKKIHFGDIPGEQQEVCITTSSKKATCSTKDVWLLIEEKYYTLSFFVAEKTIHSLFQYEFPLDFMVFKPWLQIRTKWGALKMFNIQLCLHGCSLHWPWMIIIILDNSKCILDWGMPYFTKEHDISSVSEIWHYCWAL